MEVSVGVAHCSCVAASDEASPPPAPSSTQPLLVGGRWTSTPRGGRQLLRLRREVLRHLLLRLAERVVASSRHAGGRQDEVRRRGGGLRDKGWHEAPVVGGGDGVHAAWERRRWHGEGGAWRRVQLGQRGDELPAADFLFCVVTHVGDECEAALGPPQPPTSWGGGGGAAVVAPCRVVLRSVRGAFLVLHEVLHGLGGGVVGVAIAVTPLPLPAVVRHAGAYYY
eukprot:200505-Prorocentrum_minimum.AAC.2